LVPLVQIMTSRFKIEFGNHRHRQTGFLSNASRYSFVLDNKEWPTVEHYVCAQPFKGEPLEEQLRRSASPWHLHFLLRGKRSSYKEGTRVIKKYSKPSKPSKPSFQQNKLWYQKAINNKFFQNQRIMERLLNTGNAILVDITCPYTGPILETIRKQCREERFQKNFMFSRQELEASPDVQDLSSSVLTSEDYAIINGLINAAWKYVKKTEKTCIYVEFIENALIELYPKRAEFIIMLYQIRFPQIIKQMPRFSTIIKQIYEIFRKQDPYQEYDLSGSYLIGEILRWRKIYASPSEAAQFLQIVAPNFLSKDEVLFSSPLSSRFYGDSQDVLLSDFTSALGKNSTSALESSSDFTSTLESSSDLISTLEPSSDFTSTLESSSDLISTLEKPSSSTLEKPSSSTLESSSDLTSTLEKPSTSTLESSSDLTSTLEKPSSSTLESSSDLTSTLEKPSSSTLESSSDLTSTLEKPSSSTLESSSDLTSTLEKPSTSTLEPPSDLTSTLEKPSTSTLESSSDLTSTLEKPSTSTLESSSDLTSTLEETPTLDTKPISASDSVFLYPLKTP